MLQPELNVHIEKTKITLEDSKETRVEADIVMERFDRDGKKWRYVLASISIGETYDNKIRLEIRETVSFSHYESGSYCDLTGNDEYFSGVSVDIQKKEEEQSPF